MAKYYGSPWGHIRGKLGEAVGSVAKGGIPTVRAYRKTKNLTSKETLMKVYAGKFSLSEIPVRQFNIVYATFGTLNRIAHTRGLIYPIWLSSTERTSLTPATLFIKRNFASFYHSLPDRDSYYSCDNLPDLQKIILSDGRIEGAKIETAYCDKATGKISVDWDPTCYSTGSPDDLAYLVAIYWRITARADKLPPFMPAKNLKLWGLATLPVALRSDGRSAIYIDTGLETETAQLVVFLFFSNPQFGYSVSTAIRVL